ncbi:MAG: SLC13 family permease [Armatimonadota bacterium]
MHISSRRMRTALFFRRARRWVLALPLRRIAGGLAGLIVFAIVYALPTPQGLRPEAHHCLALLALLVIYWATEPVPLPVTAFLVGVGLVVLRIRDDPDDAFMPYARNAVFFILGALILAQGLAESGLDQRLAYWLLAFFGKSFNALLASTIAVTTVLAAFLPSHSVAAIMVPVLLMACRQAKLQRTGPHGKALMLGMALAASAAGLASPSGGARNAIVLSLLRHQFDQTISYGHWVAMAAPIAAILSFFLFGLIKLCFRPPNQQLAVEPAEVHAMGPRQWLAIGIFALTVVLWFKVGTSWGLGTVAMLGAILMYVSGVVNWERTQGGLSWGVIFIYGAALAIGEALAATGGARWITQRSIQLFPFDSQTGYLAGVVVFTSLMTQVMGAGAATGVMAPTTLSLAEQTGIDPQIMGLTTAVSASFSFILVVTPPLIIAYASGAFTPRDLRRIGIPYHLLAMIVTVAAVVFYWRLFT